MGVFDVNTAELIEELAEEFKKQDFKQPAFVDFVKTGMHRERAPQRRDWYYIRMASILYRLYKEGNLGTGSLRTYYGGRKNRGTQKHHSYKASGKIIRTCLQELEKHGLVKKEKKGRTITGPGQKLLNEKAKQVQEKTRTPKQRMFETEMLFTKEEKKEETGKKQKTEKDKEDKKRAK